jgi:hypothetical protein
MRRSGIILVLGGLAAGAWARAPLEPALPWDPGGWSGRAWLGLAIAAVGFVAVAALILRLGRPPEEPGA